MNYKREIFEILAANPESFVSGQKIGEDLNCSRTTVSTTVRELQQDGCEIETITKKGYRLLNSFDFFSVSGIKDFSHNDFWDIKVENKVTSTNILAKELINSGHNNVAVIADEQTEGRGRLGKTFASPRGSLYLSVAFQPDSTTNTALITAAAAVAVCRTLKKLCGFETQIKWVNDIYFGGRKICGILTEGTFSLENNALENIVIGIGINLKKDTIPPELKDIAIALDEIVGGFTNKNELAALLLYELAEIKSEKNFMDEYREKSCVIGKDIVITSTGKTAKAIGINDNANLEIKYANGKKDVLNSGEISIKVV